MAKVRVGFGPGLRLSETNSDVTHSCPDLDRARIFSMRAGYMPGIIRARVVSGFSLPRFSKLAKKKIDKKG